MSHKDSVSACCIVCQSLLPLNLWGCFSAPISRDFPVHCTYNFDIQCAAIAALLLAEHGLRALINDDVRAKARHAHSTGHSMCVSNPCGRAKRATRRFNALFQKANKQLINIFKLLLTDNQHTQKTASRQKRYFPEKTQREEKRTKSLTAANGIPFSVKVNEMCRKKKYARWKKWPHWAAGSRTSRTESEWKKSAKMAGV